MDDQFPAINRPVEKYSYVGRPLTPAIITHLAPALVTDSVFKRMELIAVVENYHVSRGGLESRSDPAMQVKKSLLWMADRGMIEAVDLRGTWRWVQVPKQGRTLAPIPVRRAEAADGGGEGSLYAYYFPTYRVLAETHGQSVWPIKIGMTSAHSPDLRIAQQCVTMPEGPVLAYSRSTKTPRRLERAVHSILFHRGRWLEDALGSEWYSSNPREIAEIVHFIYGESCSCSTPHERGPL